MEWLNEYLDKTQSTAPKGENYLEEKVKKWIPGMALHWADENAIPLENMSLKYMDAERILPGPHSLAINGYDRFIKVVSSGLKKNVKVLLDHVVEKIEYDGLVSYFKLNEKQVEALSVHMQDLSNSSSLMPQYNIPIIIGSFARGSYTSIPLRASQADLENFSIPVGVQSYGVSPLCGGDDDEEKDRMKKRRRTTRKQQRPEKRLKAVDDNENGRIFFASEHTSPSRFASVHGALMTGQREAGRILGQECPS
ncbi:MAG: hypothetical protein J3R72DRAFT_492548 [Linnemannia gamsii]|nr:MAG: hypothetical protein J3R72DRAFT_492548 [Linnemannia gamsii]